MKMHPKPMKRHTKHVEGVSTSLSIRHGQTQAKDEFHVRFQFDDDSFQLLTMGIPEAEKFAERIRKFIGEHKEGT